MHRFKLFAILAIAATFVFSAETQAQRGKFLKRIRDDIFGSQPAPQQPKPKTPTLAQPRTTPQNPYARPQTGAAKPGQQSQYSRQSQQYSQYQQRLQQQQRAQQQQRSQYQQMQQRSVQNRQNKGYQRPQSPTLRSKQPLPSAGRNTAANRPNRREENRNAIATREGFGLKLDTNRNDELFVAGIDPRGNASQAGLKRGDVVLEIGGVVATTVEEYDQISKAMSPGDQMEFRIERHGQTDKKLVTWGELPDFDEEESEDLDDAPRSSIGSSSRSRNYDFVPPREGQEGSQSVLNSPRGNAIGASYGSGKQVQQLSRTVQQQQQTIRQLQSELTRLRSSLQSGRR